MIPSPLSTALLAIVGLFIGSFLGALVVRLPAGKPVVLARSECPNCHKQLRAYELVPLASWMVQGGRCRNCRQPISRFYPGMELGAALVPLWAGLTLGGLPLLFSCALGWLLFALAVMDFRVLRLSDALTIPLAFFGMAGALAMDWQGVTDHLIGAAAGFASLFLLARAYKALRGREGLGLGDAKLLGAGGVWIGWQGLAPAVLIASLSALVFILALSIRGRSIEPTTRIPFGTFLALGIWIVWLYVPRN
jgi:leader peptidase (prepilin peptidase)/N-methyltransferase